jgi:hypothetical protein
MPSDAPVMTTDFPFIEAFSAHALTDSHMSVGIPAYAAAYLTSVPPGPRTSFGRPNANR